MKKALVWLSGLILLCVLTGCCAAFLAGCSKLEPKDAKYVAVGAVAHQALLDKCKAEARDAGNVAAFDSCVDGGVK